MEATRGQVTGGYDSGIIGGFRARLLEDQMRITAKIQKNGNSIFVGELSIAEQVDKFPMIERHGAEVGGYKEQLRDVEGAIQKCGDGTYGRCSKCGALIELERLEAAPAATMCVKCANHKRRPRQVFADQRATI